MTLRVFHLFFTQDYCWRILINFTAYSGLWLKISLGKALFVSYRFEREMLPLSEILPRYDAYAVLTLYNYDL